jgi:hypothetical protein
VASLVSSFALALLLQTSVSQGVTVTYTDSAAFLANVAPGALFTNFNSLGGFGPTPNFSYSGNGFTVSLATTPAANDFFHGSGFVSVNVATESIVLTFTGTPVTALGGNLFPSSAAGTFLAGNITVVLSDGTTNVVASTSVNDYRGFISDTPITSMTIFTDPNATVGPFRWPSLDNLTVGVSAIPEPVSLASLGLVSGLMLQRRRRRSS